MTTGIPLLACVSASKFDPAGILPISIILLAFYEFVPMGERLLIFDLHLIVDSYATHRHPKVRAWLDRNARFKMHFMPASSSWLDMVERFFADLTGDVIQASRFTSVHDLGETSVPTLTERNTGPMPYVWKARGADILAKIQRARAAAASALPA